MIQGKVHLLHNRAVIRINIQSLMFVLLWHEYYLTWIWPVPIQEPLKRYWYITLFDRFFSTCYTTVYSHYSNGNIVGKIIEKAFFFSRSWYKICEKQVSFDLKSFDTTYFRFTYTSYFITLHSVVFWHTWNNYFDVRQSPCSAKAQCWSGLSGWRWGLIS